MSLHIDKTKELIQEISLAHRDSLVSRRFAPFLTGIAGIGKTEIIKSIGTSLDMGVIITHVAQLEPSDLIGIPRSRKVSDDLYIQKFDLPSYLPHAEKDADGSYILEEDSDGIKRPIFKTDLLGSKIKNKKQLIEKHGSEWSKKIKGFILFFDEINRAVSDDTKQAIFELPGDYSLHEYEVPPCCVIIAAGNPSNSDYEVNSMDEDVAWMDRFLHIDVTTSQETVLKHLGSVKAHPSILTFLSSDPSAFSKPSTPYEINIERSPRSYEKLSNLIKEIPSLTEDREVFTEICVGFLGTDYGIAFVSHFYDNPMKLINSTNVLLDYGSFRQTILDLVEENKHSELTAIVNNIYAEILNEEHFTSIFESENMISYVKEPSTFSNLIQFLTDLDSEHRALFVKKTAVITYFNQKVFVGNDADEFFAMASKDYRNTN